MRLLTTVVLVCALASPALAEGDAPEFNAPAPKIEVAAADAERGGGGQAYQDTLGGAARAARGVFIVQAGDGPITLGYAPQPVTIADAR